MGQHTTGEISGRRSVIPRMRHFNGRNVVHSVVVFKENIGEYFEGANGLGKPAFPTLHLLDCTVLFSCWIGH